MDKQTIHNRLPAAKLLHGPPQEDDLALSWTEFAGGQFQLRLKDRTALGGALKHNSSTHARTGPYSLFAFLKIQLAGLGELGISTQRYTTIVTSLTMFVSLYVARG